MALGTHLTIRDYLITRGGTDFWERNSSLVREANLPLDKRFGHILSSCLPGQKMGGMTVVDYLANPVKLKTAAMMKCLETSPQTKLREMDLSPGQKDLSSGPVAAGKQGQRNPEIGTQRAKQESIECSIDKAALKYDLPPELIRGVIKAESDFQVRAESSAGARGLMQLMPATAEELGVKNLFDIDQNIDGGTRYLRNMLDRFGNDLKKALAAYNAGPGTVERYGGRVPYNETTQYVERVLKFAGITV